MNQEIYKEDTSIKILKTAFGCLSENGYANVSMRNIADAAGVALSQLSYYYKSKEKLFIEVINMMMNQYLKEIEITLESTLNAKDKLTALVIYFKGLINENPKLLKLFIDFTAQALWIPSFREQLDVLFNALTEIIEKNISVEAMVINNDLSEYSQKSIAKLTLGALFGTSIQIMLGTDKDSVIESLNLMEGLVG